MNSFAIACSILCVSLSANAVVNGTHLHASNHPEVVYLNIERLNASGAIVEETCTGVAIEHNLVLTAGHCLSVSKQGNIQKVIYTKLSATTADSQITALTYFTNYIEEEFVDDRPEQLVPGCSLQPKPVPTSKTSDLGLLKFPDNTFLVWSALNLKSELMPGDVVEYYGYGAHVNTLNSVFSYKQVKADDLRYGKNVVWRTNTQRINFYASLQDSYAVHGDSGSPLYNDKGEVVAIMSTIDEKCETQFGDDYAILNTATKLSSLEALTFLEEAFEFLH